MGDMPFWPPFRRPELPEDDEPQTTVVPLDEIPTEAADLPGVDIDAVHRSRP